MNFNLHLNRNVNFSLKLELNKSLVKATMRVFLKGRVSIRNSQSPAKSIDLGKIASRENNFSSYQTLPFSDANSDIPLACYDHNVFLFSCNSNFHFFQDISGNKLKDVSSLNSLTHLLTLKADKNLLRSAKLDEVLYLGIPILYLHL